MFTSGVASRCAGVLGAHRAGQQPRQHHRAQRQHGGTDDDQRGVVFVDAAHDRDRGQRGALPGQQAR